MKKTGREPAVCKNPSETMGLYQLHLDVITLNNCQLESLIFPLCFSKCITDLRMQQLLPHPLTHSQLILDKHSEVIQWHRSLSTSDAGIVDIYAKKALCSKPDNI